MNILYIYCINVGEHIYTNGCFIRAGHLERQTMVAFRAHHKHFRFTVN